MKYFALIIASMLLSTCVVAQGTTGNRFHINDMSAVILSLPSMTCPVCPITVKKALEELPVCSVKTDLKTKTAIVIFNPKKIQVKALIKATTDAGYPSTVVNEYKLWNYHSD